MGFIYIITNNANNKVYIGQTVNTIEHRMKQHQAAANKYTKKIMNHDIQLSRVNNAKIYRAMHEIGVNNFVINLIEEVDNNLLDEAEIKYIKQYNSIDDRYNSKGGGGHGLHCEETKQTISEKTKIGITTHIDNYRKHDMCKGLPKHCVYVKIKGSNSVAINKHPKCKWKSFTARKYGSEDAAVAALLDYYYKL